MIGTSYSDWLSLYRGRKINLGYLLPVGSHEALELLRQRWSSKCHSLSYIGTGSWEDPSVEWLQTSILTELEGTPCERMRDGASTTDIQTAYIWIVRDLVSSRTLEQCNQNDQIQRKRQTLHLKRNESVKLVRQYAKCMNEISCVYDISEEKVYRLEELRKRRVEFEMGLTAGVTMPNDQPKLSERIEERIEMIKANHKHLPRLLKDLKGSLDVVRRKASRFRQEV